MSFNALLMWFGGCGLLLGGIIAGDLPQWHWQPRGLWAMLYLAVVGSALTYTAYGWLLKNVRTDRVATFAYVNPAIATLLGWVVLGETLSPQQLLGMLVILGGVALVTLPRRSGSRGHSRISKPCESTTWKYESVPIFVSRWSKRSTRPELPMTVEAAHDTRPTMMAPPTAVQNPEIVNPGTIQATSPIIAALSTSRNRPSVSTVIGRVRMNAIGRTTALTRPSRTAAIASLAPGTELEAGQQLARDPE